MRKIYLILLTFILIAACKKEKTQPEEPANTNAAPNQPSNYKKLKSQRSVDTYTYGTTNIMTQNYTYNSVTGRLSTISQMDSSYSSSVWTVRSFTSTFNYNSSGKVTSYVVPLPTVTYTVAYIYDSNNNIKYELSLSSTSSLVDTTFYTFSGSNTLQTRYNSSGQKYVQYYSYNWDSVVNYSATNAILYKQVNTYNQTLNLVDAYWMQFLPVYVGLSKHEIVSSLNSGSSIPTVYTYTYDAQNYQVTRQSTGPAHTNTINYTYY